MCIYIYIYIERKEMEMEIEIEIEIQMYVIFIFRIMQLLTCHIESLDSPSHNAALVSILETSHLCLKH